jgi:hypothetical protein
MSSILKVDTIQDQSGNNIINENAHDYQSLYQKVLQC